MSDEGYEVGRKAPYLIFALFILMAMVAGLVWILTKFIATPVVVHEQIYLDVYQERFLSSPDCFAYADPKTAVVYSGVIDIQKFTKERFAECFKLNDRSPYEFYLTLKYGTKELAIATEDFRLAKKEYPVVVLVQDGTERIKGTLFIRVQGEQ